jgi:hypothetical protein
MAKTLGKTWEVHGLEAREKSQFTLKDGTTIGVKGTLDRIDWDGTKWRVLDYKTGTVVQKNMQALSWNVLTNREAKNEYLLQLGIYGWLWSRNHKEPLELALIPLKEQGGKPIPLQVNKETVFEFEAFTPVEHIVANWLEDLLDPTKEISLAPDHDSCTYCPFQVACGRA